MTDATAPAAERCLDWARRRPASPPRTASTAVQAMGTVPRRRGRGGAGGGGLSPGAALGTVPEVWGLSLGMEDFHAAGPSDLL